MPVRRAIWNIFFGCRHRELSRPFTTANETYKVCLKCGAHLGYSLQTMSLVRDQPKRGGNALAPASHNKS